MREAVAAAGGYVSPYDQRRHLRVQLIAVGELLAGHAVQMPAPARVNVTLRRSEPELPRVAEEQSQFTMSRDDGDTERMELDAEDPAHGADADG